MNTDLDASRELDPQGVVFIEAFITYAKTTPVGLVQLLELISAQVGVLTLMMAEPQRQEFLDFAADYIRFHALDRVSLQKETMQ